MRANHWRVELAGFVRDYCTGRSNHHVSHHRAVVFEADLATNDHAVADHVQVAVGRRHHCRELVAQGDRFVVAVDIAINQRRSFRVHHRHQLRHAQDARITDRDREGVVCTGAVGVLAMHQVVVGGVRHQRDGVATHRGGEVSRCRVDFEGDVARAAVCTQCHHTASEHALRANHWRVELAGFVRDDLSGRSNHHVSHHRAVVFKADLSTNDHAVADHVAVAVGDRHHRRDQSVGQTDLVVGGISIRVVQRQVLRQRHFARTVNAHAEGHRAFFAAYAAFNHTSVGVQVDRRAVRGGQARVRAIGHRQAEFGRAAFFVRAVARTVGCHQCRAGLSQRARHVVTILRLIHRHACFGQADRRHWHIVLHRKRQIRRGRRAIASRTTQYNQRQIKIVFPRTRRMIHGAKHRKDVRAIGVDRQLSCGGSLAIRRDRITILVKKDSRATRSNRDRRKTCDGDGRHNAGCATRPDRATSGVVIAVCLIITNDAAITRHGFFLNQQSLTHCNWLWQLLH